MSATTRLTFARGLYGLAGALSLVLMIVMAWYAVQGYRTWHRFEDAEVAQVDLSPPGELPRERESIRLKDVSDISVHVEVDTPMTLVVALAPVLLATLAWCLDPTRGRSVLAMLASVLVLTQAATELLSIAIAVRMS